MTAKRKIRLAPETTENPVATKPEADESSDLFDLPASQIKSANTSWFWPNRLENSTVAIFQGEKEAGKSTWLRYLAAVVTAGIPLPGERKKRKPTGSVLWYAGEEGLTTRVRPGLEAAGADLDKCFLADCMGDDSGRQLQLPNDTKRLEERILIRDARLVVIDPVFCFSDGTCDLEGPTGPAMHFMKEIGKVAAATKALIILSRNLTKDTSKGALASGRGSAVIGQVARSVLHVQALPGNTGLYALAVAACNSGRKVPALTYTLEEKLGRAVIAVQGEAEITADELLGGDDADLDRSLLQRAKELIKSLLQGGRLDSKVVKAKGEAAMISVRTLQSAAKAMGVRMQRSGSRESTIVYWLPPK